MVQAGAAITVKYPKEEAIAVIKPRCIVSCPKWIVIGPKTATVAELLNTFANSVVIATTVISVKRGTISMTC